MPRNIAKIEVAYSLLTTLLQGHGMARLETNLPCDVDIISVEPSERHFGVVEVTIEGPSLEPIEVGQEIPEFPFLATRFVSEHEALLDLVDRHQPVAWIYLLEGADPQAHAYLVTRKHGVSTISLCGFLRPPDATISLSSASWCRLCAKLSLTRMAL